MEKLGIITYDMNHLKTEQIFLRLIGRYDIKVYALPYIQPDTLEALARRHYENEIQMLAVFCDHLEHPKNPFAGIAQGESRCRMKAEQEAELPNRFEQYKRQVISSAGYTADGQMPLSLGHSRKSLAWRSAPRDLRQEAA